MKKKLRMHNLKIGPAIVKLQSGKEMRRNSIKYDCGSN